MTKTMGLALALSALLVLGAAAVQAQQNGTSFFITSVGKDDGADLGGLEVPTPIA